MNKKGIIALIVAVVLIVIGFMIFRSDDAVSPEDLNYIPPAPEGVDREDYAPVTSENTDTTLLGRLGRASVSATEDGSRVALVDGAAQFTIAGTNTRGTVTLGNVAVEKAYGSRNDVLASLTVNSGSAGTHGYVVLFEDRNNALTDRSYAFIGDRAVVTGIRTDEVADTNIDYVVSVSYRDYEGVNRTKILVVENGAFNPAKEISL